eukprot:739590-Pyramimonas_sp.AAC.1
MSRFGQHTQDCVNSSGYSIQHLGQAIPVHLESRAGSWTWHVDQALKLESERAATVLAGGEIAGCSQCSSPP